MYKETNILWGKFIFLPGLERKFLLSLPGRRTCRALAVMRQVDFAAAGGTVVVSAIVDGSDFFIGVVHDTMRVRAVWQADVMADLVEDDGSKPVVEFFLIRCLQPVVADDGGLAGAEAQPENPPNFIFFFRFFCLPRFVLVGREDVFVCEADDLGNGVVGFPGEPADEGIGGIAFAFGEI